MLLEHLKKWSIQVVSDNESNGFKRIMKFMIMFMTVMSMMKTEKGEMNNDDGRNGFDSRGLGAAQKPQLSLHGLKNPIYLDLS